jgi:hypothetical protein
LILINHNVQLRNFVVRFGGKPLKLHLVEPNFTSPFVGMRISCFSSGLSIALAELRGYSGID